MHGMYVEKNDLLLLTELLVGGHAVLKELTQRIFSENLIAQYPSKAIVYESG
jgi:hypothetical protein